MSATGEARAVVISHDQAVGLFGAYLRADIDGANRAAVRAHFQGCEVCRRKLEVLGLAIRAPVRSPSDLDDLLE